MDHSGTGNRTVAVFGAYGHTGRFVVSELRERGWVPVLSGRDAGKLLALTAVYPGLDVRLASVDDPASLDRALAGAAAVINCAGPFASTAGPVIEAALRARVPYLDVAAELEAIADTFEHYAEHGGVAIVPAMAFYGGLGDLLATAAIGDWPAADEIQIAYALSSWQPTFGTRAAGQVSRQRRNGRRVVYANQQMEFRTGDLPVTKWTFPEPIGPREVMGEFTMADSVTIPRHLRTPRIRTYMTAAAAADVVDPDASPPEAVDESGRSAQTFLVEVVARRGDLQRRAVAWGRDIYAVTAPLVVEATHRVLSGQITTTGVASAGEIFDAHDFLRSLSPSHLSLEFA